MVIKSLVAVTFFILLLTPAKVRSQKNDTLKLREVEIRASFTPRTQGFKKVLIDSSLLMPRINTDLSTILQQHSTVFIKTYGNGSLATASLRGTSANHTQVEWNGININSPMLGMTDFSQIPSFEFSNIEILYGAAGIAKTAGAFGGVINLVTEPGWDNKLNLFWSGSLGNFHTCNTNLGVTTGNEKFQSISKLYYTSSQNDFPFYENSQKYYQKNGQYQYFGGSEELFYKISAKDYLSARIWYNDADINIPPAVTNLSTNVIENQHNQDLYSKVEWKHLGKNNLLTAWTGFVDHNMQYSRTTPVTSEVSNHHSYSWLNRLRWSYSGWKVFLIKPGIDYNYDWVVSDEYPEKKTRGTAAAFSEFILKYPEKFSFNLILRQEMMDGDVLPLIMAFGAEYDPFNSHFLSVSMNLSKNYRYPTLNDLYWDVMGNPDLKPETDYSAEGGVIVKLLGMKNRLFIESEITGYVSEMYDLIQWEEGESGLWKPSNVKQVFARGVEAGLNFRYVYQDFTVSLNNNYHFGRSTTEAAAPEDSLSVGKQLLYIPVHTFNTTLALNLKKWYFSWNYCYFSERYTSTTNDSYMPGYGISNIIFGKNFHLNKILLSLQLQIGNLFDLNYHSIANRPMPGRNMAVTLKFNFRK